MDLAHGLLLIASIHLLAAASPGPDFLLVTQQTLGNGRKAGLLCSVGITLGLSIHIVYSALGLAALVASFLTALLMIKLLGASYLIYLGFRGITAKRGAVLTAEKSGVNTDSNLKTIGMGVLCNALNPKAPLYFVAVFTVVITPDTPLDHIAIYGLCMMVVQLAWFSFVALALSTPPLSSRFQRFGHWINRVLGGAMLLLGLKVLLTKTSTG